MEPRAPGRIRPIAAFVLPFLFFIACEPAAKTISKPMKYDASRTDIRTRGGITRIGQEPLSGIVYALGTNGDTELVIPYENGREHGMAKAFYPNGRLKEIRYFVHGKKEGRHYGWYENGARRYEYFFSADEYNGPYREWLPDGRLLLSLNFLAGHENGLQQTWFEDGTVKSNYIIKNGRRYGLLGTKNCVNVADSVPR
jgi:antitoxin component YwqK of YwqJK toxin-antitoxin module